MYFTVISRDLKTNPLKQCWHLYQSLSSLPFGTIKTCMLLYTLTVTIVPFKAMLVLINVQEVTEGFSPRAFCMMLAHQVYLTSPPPSNQHCLSILYLFVDIHRDCWGERILSPDVVTSIPRHSNINTCLKGPQQEQKKKKKKEHIQGAGTV